MYVYVYESGFRYRRYRCMCMVCIAMAVKHYRFHVRAYIYIYLYNGLIHWTIVPISLLRVLSHAGGNKNKPLKKTYMLPPPPHVSKFLCRFQGESLWLSHTWPGEKQLYANPSLFLCSLLTSSVLTERATQCFFGSGTTLSTGTIPAQTKTP